MIKLNCFKLGILQLHTNTKGLDLPECTPASGSSQIGYVLAVCKNLAPMGRDKGEVILTQRFAADASQYLPDGVHPGCYTRKSVRLFYNIGT